MTIKFAMAGVKTGKLMGLRPERLLGLQLERLTGKTAGGVTGETAGVVSGETAGVESAGGVTGETVGVVTGDFYCPNGQEQRYNSTFLYIQTLEKIHSLHLVQESVDRLLTSPCPASDFTSPLVIGSNIRSNKFPTHCFQIIETRHNSIK